MSVRKGNLLDRLNAKYGGQFAVSPYGIRVESIITNGNSSVKLEFRSQNKNGQISPTEILVDSNDKFAFQRMGLFLLREETAAPGRSTLQSFPNEVIFPTAAGFNPKDLECLFNGYLQLKTQNVVSIEKFPSHNFRFVPQTQALAATASSATPAHNQFNPSAMMQELENFIEVDGGVSYDLTLVYPSFSGQQMASATAGINHKIVFIADGYLIRGAGRIVTGK